jgi:hypothetical protein
LSYLHLEFDAADCAGVKGQRIAALKHREPAGAAVHKQLAPTALPALEEQAVTTGQPD